MGDEQKRNLLTAEPQRAQRVLFILFASERAANKKYLV
jgi:hypothetical protein